MKVGKFFSFFYGYSFSFFWGVVILVFSIWGFRSFRFLLVYFYFVDVGGVVSLFVVGYYSFVVVVWDYTVICFVRADLFIVSLVLGVVVVIVVEL